MNGKAKLGAFDGEHPWLQGPVGRNAWDTAYQCSAMNAEMLSYSRTAGGIRRSVLVGDVAWT